MTRKRGSRASSVAASQGGSFTSGQSFIAAQHSSDTEEQVAVDMGGSIAREDRSMTHEGILLREAPQVEYCQSHTQARIPVSCFSKLD